MELIGCNLCQSRAYKTLLTKFGLNLVKCTICGLIYANPRLSKEEIMDMYNNPDLLNEYLSIFKADSNNFDLSIITNHYVLFLQLAAKWFAPGKKLLDVGCNAGFFLKAAQEMGWEVKGVEVSKPASEYARSVVKVNVHTGTLEDMRFPPETFDLVTLLDTIEHFLYPLETLKEIFRILKKDGIIILNTPDFKSLSRAFLGKDWAVVTPAEHLYNFTEKTLSQFIYKAGFKIIGIRNRSCFDTEYTNNKKNNRYRNWKIIWDYLKKKKIMEKIFWVEYFNILQLGDEKLSRELSGKYLKIIRRRIYFIAKFWIRGDMLIAVAKK